ncbi:GerAB/ArcD/ProY family transporter [Bacillus sp. FJAT-28004]|uniref:GerAB/ArcD/ProY family transporter n=1 Tax=Bacillus sp. FJAT-28004 TaxID=1679165 RepID=UPI0006B57A4C|nr:endospore germination permease [Bacillus sp. FJAT-28004]
MVKDIKINVRQFTVLVILYSVGTAILIIPSPLADIVKQDAWIAAVLGVGFGMLLVFLYTAVGNIYPDMTLVEKNEKLLGRWLGKAVSITFVFFAFITAADLLYYMADFITTQIMADTPAVAIHILFACIVVMGVRLGIENLARTAEFFFPGFVLLFIILVIFISPQIDFHNIQPVFDTGIKPMIRSTLLFVSIFSLTPVVFLMIYPVSVNQPQKSRNAFFIGTFIGGIILIIIIALAILVLGPDTTGRHMYPSFALAKKINTGNFIRVEAIMAGIWFVTIFYRTSLYFYAAVIGLAQTLNLKDYRSLTLPLGMIMVVISLILHPNVLHGSEFTNGAWIPYVSTYGLILPLVLLGVHAIRKKFFKN